MVKKISFGLALIIILAVAYNLITQTMQAVKSGDRLSKSADEVFKLEVKNKSLKEKLSKIQSPEFIEKEVRNKLGLAKKGETVVVISQEKLRLVLGASASAKPKYPNWLGWIKVFFK